MLRASTAGVSITSGSCVAGSIHVHERVLREVEFSGGAWDITRIHRLSRRERRRRRLRVSLP